MRQRSRSKPQSNVTAARELLDRGEPSLMHGFSVHRSRPEEDLYPCWSLCACACLEELRELRESEKE